jgi:hypothetical protein
MIPALQEQFATTLPKTLNPAEILSTTRFWPVPAAFRKLPVP